MENIVAKNVNKVNECYNSRTLTRPESKYYDNLTTTVRNIFHEITKH